MCIYLLIANILNFKKTATNRRPIRKSTIPQSETEQVTNVDWIVNGTSSGGRMKRAVADERNGQWQTERRLRWNERRT